MQIVAPPPLKGRFVTLEPLEESHFDELKAVADSDAAIWRYMPLNPQGDRFRAWMAWSLGLHTALKELVFAVRRNSDGAVLGSTRYLNIEAPHKRLEIGHTWYHPQAQGTYVNPECKYLLLQYAFETLGANRVEIKTDFRNARSRAAIAKLGAKEEGVLRHHMVMPDGHNRDTVMFSLLRAEWPAAKAKLEGRLNAF